MNVFDFIPDAIFGIPLLPLIGIIIGVALAVNEAVRTKFRDVALKVQANGETITFDNKYIISIVFGVIVVFFTVAMVKEAGILGPVPNDMSGLITALMAGFTEGWAVIKTLNKRIDLFIKEKATDAGLTEEQAEKIAEAVEFTEVKEEDESKISFEEL